MKIITIIGARPQFVKAAVVSRAFKKQNTEIEEIIIHTGQHYDNNMSEIFFSELSIPKPIHNLGIGGGTHGENTGRMLEAIEKILIKENPDWVLLYGDTDSTLAGALAASKLHIPIAHVEAGLRSFNKNMPEELNRILTDHASSLLFTPTNTATQNLLKEGINPKNIKQVGDVMYDATLLFRDKAQKPKEISIDENFLLCTLHRAENTDNPERLQNIFNALNEIAKTTPIILPIHPRTRKTLREGKYDIQSLSLIEPASYLEMMWLLKHCKLVVTDSGGLQKEAYFFNKPCVTTRDETEWVELTISGWNIVTGDNTEKIINSVSSIKKPTISELFYGAGNACEDIVKALI